MNSVAQAFRRAAERKAEFPSLDPSLCVPRGPSGDKAWALYFYERRDNWHMPQDDVLFLLFLAEAAGDL